MTKHTASFTGGGEFQFPSNVAGIAIVEAIGSGGDGADGTVDSGGAGGSGGAYAKTVFIPVSDRTYLIEAGTHEHGGLSSEEDGRIVLGATGDYGGLATQSFGDVRRDGGRGGAASGDNGGGGGSSACAGFNAVDGTNDGGTIPDAPAGSFGNGGNGSTVDTQPGQNGNEPGGGGGGGFAGTSTGGLGASARVVISYFTD